MGVFFSALCVYSLFSYHLPPILNLGTTNILDGGPLRPKPGCYLYEYLTYYHANKFLDAHGKNLGGVKSPTVNYVNLLNEFVYETSKIKIFGASPGITVYVPIVLYSAITPNSLGFTDAGSGFGNIILGPYLQWEPIKYRGRDLFVHRICFNLFLPIGTNKYPKKTGNPASIMTYIAPYWAGTFYFTQKWALSWRMHYLWFGENKKTHIKPGQGFEMNVSLEYAIVSKFYCAVNTYFLQQLQSDKLCGAIMPESKERVFGVGPGFAWFLPKEFTLLGHLYFETLVRNRAQGTKAILRFVKHF